MKSRSTGSAMAVVAGLAAVLLLQVPLAANPGRAPRRQLRPPRHGAWRVEAPPDRGGLPDMLQVGKLRAVSRFWKCDREGKLIAEVACFERWPKAVPDPWFGTAPAGGWDPGIAPPLDEAARDGPSGNPVRHKKDLERILLEMAGERQYGIQAISPGPSGVARPWGKTLRKSITAISRGDVRWELGAEGAILEYRSEVLLVYRIEAGRRLRRTRAQVEEILDSLRVVRPL